MWSRDWSKNTCLSADILRLWSTPTYSDNLMLTSIPTQMSLSNKNAGKCCASSFFSFLTKLSIMTFFLLKFLSGDTFSLRHIICKHTFSLTTWLVIQDTQLPVETSLIIHVVLFLRLIVNCVIILYCTWVNKNNWMVCSFFIWMSEMFDSGSNYYLYNIISLHPQILSFSSL
jgi:hypothetical protein